MSVEGEIEVIKPQAEQEETGIPALAVDAENGHGILDIDLRGYSKLGHSHEEYAGKEDIPEQGMKFDILYTGNANVPKASYKMSKSLKGYKFIVIFGAGYNSGLQKFVQKNSVLIECNDIEFGDTGSGWTIMFNDGKEIGGTFIDDTTFMLGLCVPKEWAYVTVKKIIGIY